MRATAAAALCLAALVAAPLLAKPATAGLGMPDALTPRGQLVERLYSAITLLGIITFLVVFVWLVTVIWRFRETSGHGRSTHEKERHNNKLEALWIGVPLIMVLGIGYAAYGGLVTLDRGIPTSEADMTLRIEGSQWNWKADYGQNVTLFSNPDAKSGAVADDHVFVVPAGQKVLLNITSADVVHAFNILDGNRAWFTMNDANPLGSNKYAEQVVVFPAGNYSVQCKEMCLNPGHAYMRARFSAVPADQYRHWFAERAAANGASIVTRLTVTAANGALVGAPGTSLANLTVVAQSRVILQVTPGAAPLTLTAGSSSKTIPAGETGDNFFGFDVPAAGNYTVTASNGGSLHLRAIKAEGRTVDLGAYRFLPDHLQLTAGTTYLITVPNVHSATHDLHIGGYHGGSGDLVLAASPAVGGGGSATFLFTPDAKGTFDMWCSQPGHVGLGMLSTASVTVT